VGKVKDRTRALESMYSCVNSNGEASGNVLIKSAYLYSFIYTRVSVNTFLNDPVLLCYTEV